MFLIQLTIILTEKSIKLKGSVRLIIIMLVLYKNKKVYKSIKFQQQMDQVSVYEKSVQIVDSQNVTDELIMSCMIYSAEYYPLTRNWLSELVIKCCKGTEQERLLASFEQLIQDINREIVYGPSACYVAVSERPHHEHLNSSFLTEKTSVNGQGLVQKAAPLLASTILGEFVKKEDLQQLLWYRRSNYLKLHNFVNKKISSDVLKELEVNGQSWIRITPLSNLFLTIQECLKIVVQQADVELNAKFYLLLGRLSFLHNKILQNPAKDLADLTLGNYRRYINIINKSDQKDSVTYISLLIEYSKVLLFYYKYGECEKILQFCKTLSDVEIQFTGRMGRRTKYQSFDTPQLVMNLKTKENTQNKVQSTTEEVEKDAIEMPDAKELVLKELQTVNKQKGAQIDTAHFDQDSILLERPKFADEDRSTQQTNLPTKKILVALSAIQYMWDASPKEQMLYQHIATSIQTLLKYKADLPYPVMYNLLLLRSLNEFPRVKNVQRALEQLEKMKQNFNLKPLKSTDFLYSTSYTPFSEFIRTLAEKYIEIGMTMTAIELYEKVGMIQECIDGLISKNYKEKARTLATKYQKQFGRTPKLLCMLGDLEDSDKCIELYEQAWTKSQMRNARSQRSLGWYYLKKKQHEKAADAFKKATQANFYHPNTWYTLGVCYMQLKQFQKAIPAFGQCVCIDETQGEAWGNISSCYIYQNKYKQAYSTLEQALKHSQKNWKLWSNMLSVSLKVKKFYKYFECIERLVNDEKSQVISPQILSKVISIFQYQQETSERRRLIQAMKNRLDRLYKMLVDKIGQHPMVWHSIYEYNLELQTYTVQNYKHYKKLYEQNKIDKNDVLDGYETLEDVQATVQQTLAELKVNILTSKQTQLNMTMKVGWDTNKKQSEEVVQVLQEYVTAYEKYGNRKDEKVENQFNLFIKGVRAKLQACLERPVDIKFSTK